MIIKLPKHLLYLIKQFTNHVKKNLSSSASRQMKISMNLEYFWIERQVWRFIVKDEDLVYCQYLLG